ncbi:DUF2461 domain-containing protein [Cryobacterium sp. MLB-32]|uniref:DUF2461 domain-containing protein n=1 Tax=Cryobacterium sp. MLB-32 TaxID=1529318 RepID=UPI0006902DC2|nr:DUF2461 domain-containing protein [Cryobacterium sp. MLB-32]
MVVNPNAHLSPAALDFLDELEQHNDRDWFAEHKATYDVELKAGMLEVATAINERLAAFAPDHVRPPAKAMMRIYRDVRFSNDKSPYKTHMGAYWPRQGLEKAAGAGFFLQIGARELMIAGGSYSPGPAQLLAIREYLLDHHEELRSLLAAVNNTGLFDPLDGDRLIRAPRGFPAEHPAADLLRHRRWAFTSTLPGIQAESTEFIDVVTERFQALVPLVAFLNTPVAGLDLTRSLTAGRQ